MKTHKVTIDGVEMEVVSLQDHNNTVAGVRSSAKKGLIDPKDETYQANMEKLNGYETKEWKAGVETKHFETFKINKDYADQIYTLTGINKDMEDKEVEKKLSDFTSDKKNNIYLKKPDITGGNPITEEETPKPAKLVGIGGGSFWNRKK